MMIHQEILNRAKEAEIIKRDHTKRVSITTTKNMNAENAKVRRVTRLVATVIVMSGIHWALPSGFNLINATRTMIEMTIATTNNTLLLS